MCLRYYAHDQYFRDSPEVREGVSPDQSHRNAELKSIEVVVPDWLLKTRNKSRVREALTQSTFLEQSRAGLQQPTESFYSDKYICIRIADISAIPDKMGVRTRSTTSSPVKPSSKKPEPQPEQNEPLKLFILPQDSSAEARFLLLQHPRDGNKKRYLFCPTKGLYEFTKINAPSIDPRSILFAPSIQLESESIAEGGLEVPVQLDQSTGYVNKAAEFFVATPFDATFLLLPILMPQETKKSLFQPLDDILEYQLDEDRHLKYVYKHGRQILENAMDRICDKVEAGEEKMYRLNEEKLVTDIIGRCERVLYNGLPSSMEDKFVNRALEAPVLSIKREDTDPATNKSSCGDFTDAEMESFETQSTKASTAASTVFSEAQSVTTTGTVVEDDVTTQMQRLQRLRSIFTFITSSYTPIRICTRLMSLLDSDKSVIDFAPLQNHLAGLAKLRAEAAASRSLGDFSRKRNLDEEDFNETREEKKRKLAEEEKRKKAGESMGVRALKKVDVSGMKKMSSFFTKAAPKTKT
jgi:hypothetical protein